MSDRARPEGARTYRAPSGPVVLAASAAFAAFLLGDAVLRASWQQMLLLAPWVLLALWVVYEISFASRVRVDDAGVLVQNMLRTTAFGWSAVRDIDMRWQLEFSLVDGSKVTCYGGPARSRPARVRRGDDGETAARVPAGVRDLTEIRDRWEAASPADDAPIRRSWDGPALIALAVIVVWAVAAVLIANS